MKFHVVTLFPDLIRTVVNTSITGRAIRQGVLSVETVNIRDFSVHGTMRVDDYPYGGGAGMVMEAEPVFQAVQSVTRGQKKKSRVIYLTPQAKVLNQSMVESLAQEEELILLCGHYEGIDERVLEEVVTDTVSIGDYVLTGGELAAAVLIDAVARFVPGVLHNEESSQFESLQDNLLEYPQYTRPEIWHTKQVPPVLLSGDHKKIEDWRHAQSIRRTAERRPDLLNENRQFTGIWFGAETEESLAHAYCTALSRYGTVLNYNRRKLQKQRYVADDNTVLVLVLPPEAEQEMPLQERFRNLRGNNTPVILVSPQASEDEAAMRAFLETHGFTLFYRVDAKEAQEPEQIRRHTVLIRQKMAGYEQWN